MRREIRSADEIAQWLTNNLRNRLDDCNECKVNGIKRLLQPDPNGCNWSSDIIVNTGGQPHENIAAILRELIGDAQDRFNLRDTTA